MKNEIDWDECPHMGICKLSYTIACEECIRNDRGFVDNYEV